MSEKCDLGYFVNRTNGWKIVLGDEEKGHVILISGSADKLTIACQSDQVRHPPYLGKHNPEQGCIQPLEGQDWAIICLPGGGSQKDQIRYETLLAPGSWTAEDNGGGEG